MLLDRWMKKGSVWNWDRADEDILMRARENILANGGFEVAMKAPSKAKAGKPEKPEGASGASSGAELPGARKRKKAEEERVSKICLHSLQSRHDRLWHHLQRSHAQQRWRPLVVLPKLSSRGLQEMYQANLQKLKAFAEKETTYTLPERTTARQQSSAPLTGPGQVMDALSGQEGHPGRLGPRQVLQDQYTVGH